MANADESADTQSQINELTAALGQMLSDLSPEAIACLHSNKDKLVREFGNLAARLIQHEPVASQAHETVRIKCTIGGRNYLACGFLKDGEPSVCGQTMLNRTKIDDTTAINDDEWGHLSEHRADFEKYPGLMRYHLATERRNSYNQQFFFNQQSLSYFHLYDRGWYESSFKVKYQWDRSYLVLRRSA